MHTHVDTPSVCTPWLNSLNHLFIVSRLHIQREPPQTFHLFGFSEDSEELREKNAEKKLLVYQSKNHPCGGYYSFFLSF